MQAEKDRVAAVPPTTPLVSTRPETWQVHNRQGGVMTTEQSTVQAFASAKQLGGVALAATEERVTLAGVL
jgi:hypothetical protein